jgi:hypothetical protein
MNFLIAIIKHHTRQHAAGYFSRHEIILEQIPLRHPQFGKRGFFRRATTIMVDTGFAV